MSFCVSRATQRLRKRQTFPDKPATPNDSLTSSSSIKLGREGERGAPTVRIQCIKLQRENFRETFRSQLANRYNGLILERVIMVQTDTRCIYEFMNSIEFVFLNSRPIICFHSNGCHLVMTYIVIVELAYFISPFFRA